MKLSIIEHNPIALKGFLNNPKWYCEASKVKANAWKKLYMGGGEHSTTI